jgi:hypothetical protein
VRASLRSSDTQNWIHSGVLRFSDGTREPVRAWLSNRALAPTEIRFAPRKVTWLRFEIGDAEGNEPGLVELQVFAPLSKLREIHVSVRGKDGADGSAERPLRTISAAAAIAMPGDTVTVHEGIYRERVDPPRGGEPGLPITYRGAPGELAPIIRGSEIVTGWEPVRAKPGVWTVSVPAERFGELNPFADEVHGDWFLDHGRKHHTGAVYVVANGSMRPFASRMCFATLTRPSKTTCRLSRSTYSTWLGFRMEHPPGACLRPRSASTRASARLRAPRAANASATSNTASGCAMRG